MATVEYGTVSTSDALDDALRANATFLLSDDVERETAIQRSGRDELSALADGVDPLYDEINAVLDQLGELAHPLPADQERLEDQLNSLAQAAMEARMELDSRG